MQSPAIKIWPAVKHAVFKNLTYPIGPPDEAVPSSELAMEYVEVCPITMAAMVSPYALANHYTMWGKGPVYKIEVEWGLKDFTNLYIFAYRSTLEGVAQEKRTITVLDLNPYPAIDLVEKNYLHDY